MFGTVLSAALTGMESTLVRVEADVSDGLPTFGMVGYLSAQVKEAQDRVRTAFKNSGFRLEPKRITVNLAPADLRKSGSGFDLPIAVAVAAGYGMLKGERLEKVLVIGELSLNGEVNGIRGVLPIVAAAAGQGCRLCLVPKANIREGAAVQNIDVIGVSSLKETLGYLQGCIPLKPVKADPVRLMRENAGDYEDFADVNGQEAVRRAAEVAVSGFHNLLMVGPPGVGKSLIAKRIPGILPPMSFEESMEVAKVYSVAGQFAKNGFLLLKRPFRSPHHTITARALAGGGSVPYPGEVSLAHNGVLFLDELPEFCRESLEILRQPLEDGQICITRAGGSCRFPSNVMLVAAMNPCPCGYYPDMQKCTCTYHGVQKYLRRVSTPLLDRIDITVEMSAVDYGTLRAHGTNESSKEIRERVIRTVRREEERYRGTPFRFNADLDSTGVEKYCALGHEETELMEEAYEKLELGARAYYRILKVARTIADMEGCEQIRAAHLQEALCYRSIRRDYWG